MAYYKPLGLDANQTMMMDAACPKPTLHNYTLRDGAVDAFKGAYTGLWVGALAGIPAGAIAGQVSTLGTPIGTLPGAAVGAIAGAEFGVLFGAIVNPMTNSAKVDGAADAQRKQYEKCVTGFLKQGP